VHCFARRNDARLLLQRSQLIHFYNEPISFLQGSWVLSNRPIAQWDIYYLFQGTWVVVAAHLLVVSGSYKVLLDHALKLMARKRSKTGQ